MANKEYSFYPGCSSQKGASASNLQTSIKAVCDTLGIQLNEIPDWNCCAASIGYAEGGELPRLALSARNIAISEKEHPNQDIVATCAACWLATRETKERLEDNPEIKKETNEALGTVGLSVDGSKKVRHMVEVLIEDVGYDAIKKQVKKPLDGVKVAGYVGCQTNRPFGIDGESFENPQYMDKFAEALGAEPITNYEKKVQCCGGALIFSEPEKSQAMIKDIIQAAYDQGADMIATPCPVCQMNVEIYQGKINEQHNTDFNMPVVYYSTMMAVAFGKSAKESALNGQVIRAEKLDKIAG
uniref:Heterodisulfide reductase subunit B n=1 Tax=Candidatus Kentrum sp. MB TaxID=2138164 RepID=A0A450XD11_9GAMM|nr:MAG: heterodisulfide reductase subunit B [Candidatus Kentron sp. MB]VFK75073.1 MAG: heterodisulfide reductase subunit B [Candidatus Kentron sp. MB]